VEREGKKERRREVGEGIGPKLLLNQGLSELCYATGMGRKGGGE